MNFKRKSLKQVEHIYKEKRVKYAIIGDFFFTSKKNLLHSIRGLPALIYFKKNRVSKVSYYWNGDEQI